MSDKKKGYEQFKPVGDYNAKDVQGEFNRNELPSGCMFCGFSCPNRDDGVQDAGANTVYKTSFVKER